MKIRKLILTYFISLVSATMGVFPIVAVTAGAEEIENVQYTSVLEDLQKDESFNEANYPVKAEDYSLELIQIAESVNKELFVYVYQPSDQAKELTATKVSLSTAINENFSPKLYDLTLIDTDGVFDKYKVEGLTVKEDAVRYYDIVRLQRAFDETIDKESGTDNEIVEVSDEVGQLWTACTVDGNVTYQYIYTETLLITDKWTGFIRYYDGIKLFEYTACDAWFIAFNTDKRIEKLTEATVSYAVRKYEKTDAPGTDFDEFKYLTEPKNGTVDLSDIDEVSNEPDGLLGKKYTWNRIESKDTFIKNETLTDEAKENLKGKQWVLRFLETDFTEVDKTFVNGHGEMVTGMEVSRETILRLKFETDGQAYNLGVVDNEQTPDLKPDGDIPDILDELPNWLKWLIKFVMENPEEALIALIAIIVGLPLIVSMIPTLIPAIFKLVWWIIKGIGYVIASPFLLIGWIISLFKE